MVASKLREGLSRIAGNPVDRLCDVIAAGGVCFLGIGITSAVTIFTLGVADLPLITYLLPAVWYFIAYLLQSAVLAALGKKREADYSWEGNAKYFNARQAIPAVLICVIGILLTRRLWFEYYRQLMLRDILKSFDEYSIHPFISQITSLIMMGFGIRSAFFPPGQLMSQRRVLTASGVSFLLYMLVAISYSSVSLSALMTRFNLMFGICFILYLASAAVILNQSVIVRKSQATTVAKIGNNARMCDLRMVLLWILATIVVGAAAFVVVGGIWYILRFIFFLALWYFLNSRPDKVTEKLEESDIAEAVFEGNDIAGAAMIIGAIVTIIAVIAMMIFIRTGAVQAFFKAIYSWLDSIVKLFMGKDSYVPESEINFRDETEMMTVANSSRVPKVFERRGKLTLREFSGKLSAMKNDGEKLTYSYVVMINLLRELNPALRECDTPRELAEKIGQTLSLDGIDGVTDAVELVCYAEKSPSPETTKAALDAVQRVVAKRLS